eukprot:CAMPEP_0118712890 /NCGR_PEP_ID=MMETSP0800-20121206/25142_1 /TAXON_ID=210618 ORGANISM="Striatella unipunctata, Strain CCMP2910" /NCGR_SAMPLE_ID=MMETSP0800 /ASSEMBLY_ACC=CAM_ASM_000638 /LENGTH=483 /DNA_ID=CAMNT_0006618141 /DNA_START=161 /DNA_END=1615 /DNA_ORIENTATION=+
MKQSKHHHHHHHHQQQDQYVRFFICFITLFLSLPLTSSALSLRDRRYTPGTTLNNICLGRGNPAYWQFMIPALLSLDTYHDTLDRLGYVEGDLIVNTTEMFCGIGTIALNTTAETIANMVHLLDDGLVVRDNSLGLLRLGDEPFYCYTHRDVYSDGYCGLALGMPHADHSKIRPFMDFLLGTGDATSPWTNTTGFWNLMDIQAAAETFLEGRTSITVGRVALNFFLIEFHEKILGITITEEEANEFQTFAELFLGASILPYVPGVPLLLRRRGAVYVDMYIEAFTNGLANGRIPSNVLAEEDVTLAAVSIMTGVLFALSPALGGVTRAVVGVYLNNVGDTNSKLDWSSHVDLGRAIMEAVRVYPPVMGVTYVDGAIRVAGLVGYSGYDKTVFGENAKNYSILYDTVEDYRERMISWADTALPVEGKPETSHVCPARSFSFNMLLGFLSALDVESWMEGPDGKPTVKPLGTGPFFWDEFTIVKK